MANSAAEASLKSCKKQRTYLCEDRTDTAGEAETLGSASPGEGWEFWGQLTDAFNYPTPRDGNHWEPTGALKVLLLLRLSRLRLRPIYIPALLEPES